MILHAVTAIDFTSLHLSPVLWHLHLFGRDLFDLKWYSIAYIAGIILGWTYMMRLLKAPGAPMASRHAEDLVFYATLGIIIGGRLGYVIFYGPVQFWHHPLDIFKLWDGGMSFHGGVIGTTIGIVLFARRHKLDWLRIHDYVACCAPMGLFLGRLANFVNGELWGKPTGTNWGVIFHGSAGEMARHPSQLYEAGLEGILLFSILWLAFWRTKARYAPGTLVGLFILGYGMARFAVEFYREPDQQFVGTIFDNGYLHMGQWLCLPMILGGLYLISTAKNRRQRITPIAGDESVA